MPVMTLMNPTNLEIAIAAGHSPAPVRGGVPPRALQRVRQYVDAHLNEKISVQSLANIAGLSLYHFARAFKQSEGLTPHDYLVQCRIRHAQKLLADSDVPLSEVALAAGFLDQSHFARRFRDHFGVAPSRYRSAMR
jgi:transcriptional regulator GlxA family with amidase domain